MHRPLANRWEATLNLNKTLMVTTVACLAAPAWAGPTVPLGTPLGLALGSLLGASTLGDVLPLAGSGLLVVAAASLVVGIRLARSKRSKRH